jgi:hypothetical protein
MARKISTSPMMDQPLMGSFNIVTNTLSTLGSNENMVFDPNGSGIVEFDSDVVIRNQGDLRLLESSGNGSNYIAMQAAANMAANYTITWPAAVSGTNGFFLSSDTSGNLSWSSAAGGISVSDPGASATVHYPFFGTNAGSVPTTFGPNARSNLSFVPSTGTLTATIFQGALDGSSSGGGTLTVRGTSNASKATASILMTDGVASTTTATGTLVVTGGVGISGQMTAATIVETSSIAFKENINPIDNALDLIMQLMGVTYDRKDTKEHEAGLIAEHVYKIAPDLVSCDAEGKPYGLKYTKITAYLVEAIKTLKHEIDSLKG